MRQPLILFLVGLFLAFVVSDAEAHPGRHGASASIHQSLNQLDTDGDQGSNGAGSELECCFACYSVSLTNPAGSALGIDLFAMVQPGLDEYLTRGLSHAPPDRPPRPA